ncbi:MAG: ABC transporter permease [Verrucomicrobiota bacterium]
MSHEVASKPFKEEWFTIRKDLSQERQTFLTIFSFLIPLFIWALLSYVPPFAWHPDIKLSISADQKGVKTVYSAGDRVSKEHFPYFQAAIRKENQDVLAAESSSKTIPSTQRDNLKTLRHLTHIAIKQGWVLEAEKEDDAAIYRTWGKLATGKLYAKDSVISPENLLVIQHNWKTLSLVSTEYSYKALPKTQLLKLVPTGKSSNPVYLPAPHEVLQAGFYDFTTDPGRDKPWMYQRFLHSLRIVFGGFLFSCLLGIPLGILCGTYDFFSKLVEPFIDFFRYMPAPAFSTLLVAIFLAHDAPKIALVFVGTFFQMVLVISKTTRLLDRSLLEAAQTLGAKNFHLLTRVIIPGIMPNLYNDLRILLGWSWTWLVIAELIGVKTGLTEFIETQGRWRNFDRVFPVIIAIGITGFCTDQILAWLRVYLFPWHDTAEGQGMKKIFNVFNIFKKTKSQSV